MAQQYELKQVKVRLCLKEAEPLYSNESITSSDKAVEVMAKAMAELDRECFCVVNLDAKKAPIAFHVVSQCDTAMTYVPIQNVFKTAILQNSCSILGLHNHPSGSLTPSQADLSLTRRMVEAGRIIGIPVIDHIIVAGVSGRHTSIKETNPECFNFIKEKDNMVVAEAHERVSVQSKIQEKKTVIDGNIKQKYTKPLLARQ